MVTCFSSVRYGDADDGKRNGKTSKQNETIEEVTMKFLMVVMAIHFIGEVISNKRKEMVNNNGDEKNRDVIHPAEFNMR